ncbi:hypothetical protein ALT785_160082 [Alteromonas infernus]
MGAVMPRIALLAGDIRGMIVNRYTHAKNSNSWWRCWWS